MYTGQNIINFSLQTFYIFLFNYVSSHIYQKPGLIFLSAIKDNQWRKQLTKADLIFLSVPKVNKWRKQCDLYLTLFLKADTEEISWIQA